MNIVESSAKKAKPHTRYYVDSSKIDTKLVPYWLSHYTKKKGKIRVPGTTTITGVMDKPFLVKWANEIGLNGIKLKEYVDDLADAGSCCHRMCELNCLGYEKPEKHPDMNNYTGYQIMLAENGYIKFLEWKEEYGFEPIHVEWELVSSRLMYGGTLDLYGNLSKINKVALIDIKTSKSIFGEHKSQVAGGYSLLLEANDVKYDEVWILRLGRTAEEGYDFKKIPQQEIINHQQRFKICRELYESNKICDKY